MKTTIYCFSGTGNSLDVANKIKEELVESHIEYIAQKVMQKEVKVLTEAIIIICPVYFFELPKIISQFIQKLVVEKEVYIGGVVTSGGSPGNSLYQMNQLLKKKGNELNIGLELPMGDNSLIIKTDESKLQHRLRAVEEQIKTFTKLVTQRDSTSVGVKYSIKGKIMNQVVKNTLEIVYRSNKKGCEQRICTSCGICVKVCPTDNIRLIDGYPKWSDHCEQCFACINWCGKEAIQFGKIQSKGNQYRHVNISIKDIMRQKSTSL